MRYAVAGAVIGAAMVGTVLTMPGPTIPAPAHRPAWSEPYGGCDEAGRYPHTDGWRACRRHGLLP